MLYTGFRPQAQDEASPALSLDGLLIRNPSVSFFARMRGNAMTRAGIRHGDILVIEAAESYGEGAILCAFINYEAVIRRLERGQLVASDPRIKPILLDDESLIRGQVVAAVTLLARPRLSLPVVQ